jgi:hypothetical protein
MSSVEAQKEIDIVFLILNFHFSSSIFFSSVFGQKNSETGKRCRPGFKEIAYICSRFSLLSCFMKTVTVFFYFLGCLSN